MTDPVIEAQQAADRLDPQPRAQLTVLASVLPEQVRWLWPGRIPRAKLTVADGDPGLGKSTFTLDIAARVSTGSPMPDGSRSDISGPSGVVLLSAEDGLADTIRPRLDAAGADCSRIVALDGYLTAGTAHSVTLTDIDVLRQAIHSVRAVLLIVDPLMAYLPGRSDSHRDQDIRAILSPLAALAEQTGAAIVVVRHLNKASGGAALYRGSGSIGIIGAARSGLLVAQDPDDDSRRILVVTKSNLAAPVPGLAFRLEAYPPAMRVRWEGKTDHTAASLLAIPEEPEDRSALDDAMRFLRDVLGVDAKAATDIRTEAKAAGVAERTLFRAKAALRVASQKTPSGTWQWVLPPDQPCHLKPLGNVGNVGSLGNLDPANTPPLPDEHCQDCQGCQHCQPHASGTVVRNGAVSHDDAEMF